MRKINIKSYPKFWDDFVGRVHTETDPSSFVASANIKQWLKDWYGITVHITSNGTFADVYMHDEEYTAFLLRWS